MDNDTRPTIDTIGACRFGNALVQLMGLDENIRFKQSVNHPDSVQMIFTSGDECVEMERTLFDAIGETKCPAAAAQCMLSSMVLELLEVNQKYTPLGMFYVGGTNTLTKSCKGLSILGAMMRTSIKGCVESGNPFDTKGGSK